MRDFKGYIWLHLPELGRFLKEVGLDLEGDGRPKAEMRWMDCLMLFRTWWRLVPLGKSPFAKATEDRFGIFNLFVVIEAMTTMAWGAGNLPTTEGQK